MRPHSLLRPALAGLLVLAACAAGPARAQSAWLFGERHDQPDHQRQTAQAVRQLAGEGRLHAVVLEMAERGASTAGLPREAGEPAAREALRWNEDAWPWAAYREVVMHAVAAGVPVLGGNLPREALRDAMRQPHWDAAVPPEAHTRLIDAVREGHCGLLPDSQLAPMVRMQLARDRSLAETLAAAAQGAGPQAVVLMLSGSVHASRATGVPLQLPAVAPQLQVRSIAFSSGAAEAAPGFDEARPAQATPGIDHCAELRRRGMPGMAPTPASAASR